MYNINAKIICFFFLVEENTKTVASEAAEKEPIKQINGDIGEW